MRESGFAFLWGAVSIFVISACGRATSNMVSTTLPLLGKYVFGAGTFYGGAALSVYSLMGIAGNYFVSPRLSGRAQKTAVLASTAVVTASSALLTLSGPLTSVLLGGVIGFSFGIVFPSVITTASLAEGGQGERLLGLFSTGLAVSLVLGPLLEGYILAFSYREVFLVFSFIAAAMFFAAWKVDFGAHLSAGPRAGADSRKGIYAATLVSSVFYIPFAALTAFLPIYAAQVFGTDASVSYLTFVPLFAVSLCTRAYMTYRPFKGVRLPIFASVLMTVMGLVAMAVAPGYLFFLGAMALFGFPHGATYTISLVVVSRASTEGERNAAVSLLQAYTNVVYVVVPVVLGYLIGVAGIQASFLFLLVPTVATSLALSKMYGGELSGRYARPGGAESNR